MTHLEAISLEGDNMDGRYEDSQNLVSAMILQAKAAAMVADELHEILGRIDQIGPILQGIEAKTR